MVIFKTKPKFMKFVARPADAVNSELAKAQPVYIDGLPSGGGSVEWADVTGKPATFTPTIGSTATTAKAGNYVPAWADVTGKPSTFAPTIGTTATTAAAGNHNHAITADAGSGLAAAANLQALAVALSTRIKALEDQAP